MSYRVSEAVLSAHLQGEAVLLELSTKSYYQLNATAACVWQGLESGEGEAALVARLCAAFDVAPADAAAAVSSLIPALLARQLIRARAEAP